MGLESSQDCRHLRNVNPVTSLFSCNFNGSLPASARARFPQTVEQLGWRKREDLLFRKFSIVVVREGLLGAARLAPRPRGLGVAAGKTGGAQLGPAVQVVEPDLVCLSTVRVATARQHVPKIFNCNSYYLVVREGLEPSTSAL